MFWWYIYICYNLVHVLIYLSCHLNENIISQNWIIIWSIHSIYSVDYYIIKMSLYFDLTWLNWKWTNWLSWFIMNAYGLYFIKQKNLQSKYYILGNKKSRKPNPSYIYLLEQVQKDHRWCWPVWSPCSISMDFQFKSFT